MPTYRAIPPEKKTGLIEQLLHNKRESQQRERERDVIIPESPLQRGDLQLGRDITEGPTWAQHLL